MLQIKEAQKDDDELWAIVQNVEDGKHTEFSVDDDGVVWFEDLLCVPSDQALHEKKRHDAIWVVVDWLTKSAHFLPIRKNYSISKLAEIFRQEIVRLHGTPTSIVSDRDPRGVKRFGIKGKLSPRFIGPFEILERIVEVSYRLALPPQLSHVHDVFHVSLLRGYHYHPLHVASYPFDQIQPDMSLSEEPEFILDRQERVMRNKTIPGVKRFGIKGKLSPRFIGPFEILERIGELSHVHDVFHVSLLRGYHYHPLHVASYPFEQIHPDISLSEEPEYILDRQERVMRNKTIPFVKILWKNHLEREATGVTEESMGASYPRPEAYAMTWEVLKKRMTDKYCSQGELKKLEVELWNLKVKGNDVLTYTNHFPELTLICTKFVANENEKIDKYISGLPNNIYGNVKSSKLRTLDETIELTNDLMDQKLCTYAERADNKRKTDVTSRNNHVHQQQPFKKQNVAKVYNIKTGKRKPYEGSLPKNAQGWVYAVGNAEKNGNAPMNPNSNFVTGTFLLNNRYASILFDTGADRSFISIAFSSLVNIDPTSLGISYDVELADGKIVGIDTIIRGCTINFLNHPFNIDLIPVELGSFDVIIGMDWLRRCDVVIVCDKKLVQIPYGDETLTFHGNESNNERESRLTVISCSKAQRYMAKGCQTFMAHIFTKKEEDKSEGKQLEDVPIVRDFPKVFPEDLLGLPPA
nr:reverse transcriptase domain-containing protein [Tanacetum cinerariifolium]